MESRFAQLNWALLKIDNWKHVQITVIKFHDTLSNLGVTQPIYYRIKLQDLL